MGLIPSDILSIAPFITCLTMPEDLPIFLLTASLFILYLILSAWTEMGTKLPFPRGRAEANHSADGEENG